MKISGIMTQATKGFLFLSMNSSVPRIILLAIDKRVVECCKLNSSYRKIKKHNLHLLWFPKD